MKRILTIDAADYADCITVLVKHTVRAIIKKNGKYAMQQSGNGVYKIPGGGVEGSETHIDTLVREVKEETGLTVRKETIKEIGEILELRRDIFDAGTRYECHTYFYSCDVEDEVGELCMTESEIEKGFHPTWADADEIVNTNRKIGDKITSNRDTSFMELLLND